MRNKMIKNIIIIISIIFLFNIYMSFVNQTFAISNPTENPDIWISPGIDVGDEHLSGKISPVLGIIRAFGIVASFISLAIIAIKIMYGSIDEKANYKQTLMPWAAGAIMLFAMTTIPSLIYNAIGEEKMSADINVSTQNKVMVTYCINGKELTEYVGSATSSSYDHSAGIDCDCNGTSINGDENYKYKCASCGERLEKIGKYYYCKECGKVYN